MTPDDLKPAKFRGIECAARELSMRAGRRKARDTIPGRDGSVSEDLGLLAREYTIQFVCTGDDWKDTYNALIDAFEDAQPAEFQHPDGTILTVTPDGPIEFSILSVGEATVSGTLIEETAANRIDAEDDAAAGVDAAADSNDALSEGRLNAIFAAGEAATQAVDDALDGINDAVDVGRKVSGQIQLAVARARSALMDVAETPSVVASVFTDLYASITDWSLLTETLSAYHLSEVTKAADYAAIADPDARAMVRNVYELNLHCANCITGQMARIANAAAYEAFDDAQLAVATVASYGDDLAAYLDADQLAGLDDLRALLVSAVLTQSQSLPRLKNFVPWRVMSASEIAQYLYQDGTRAAEIVARNSLSHPGFIGPDEVLRVLEV